LDFLKCFYSLHPVEKDWQFPRILLDLNTKIPSRGRHLQLGESDPSPHIAATIEELSEAGATIAVVPCNTAHILFNSWAADTPIPVINIVDATISMASEFDAGGLLALTTESLATENLYGSATENAGLRYYRPTRKLQSVVTMVIEEIKKTGKCSQKKISSLLSELFHCNKRGVDTFIIGCTELSLISETLKSAGLKVIDSNIALATAAYRAIHA